MTFDEPLLGMTQTSASLIAVDIVGQSYVSLDGGLSWDRGERTLFAGKFEFGGVATQQDNRGAVAMVGDWNDGSKAAVSPDGMTWSALPDLSAYTLTDAVRTPRGLRFLAYYRSDMMTPSVFAFDDGWRPIELPNVGAHAGGIQATAFAPELGKTFFLQESAVLETDGETWVEHPLSEPLELQGALTYGGGRLVGVGIGVGGSRLVSWPTDGSGWFNPTDRRCEHGIDGTSKVMRQDSDKGIFHAIGFLYYRHAPCPRAIENSLLVAQHTFELLDAPRGVLRLN